MEKNLNPSDTQPISDIELGDEGEENEEDLGSSDKVFQDVVLGGSDWTSETILSQLKQGNILLNPYFQRREAWTSIRQSKFIESLFLGLPIPQLVLAESRKNRGKYIVVDGKQRLLSLLHFAGSESAKIEPLKLAGLDIMKGFNGKTYDDIKSDPILASQLSRFENQTIRTSVLKNWTNEDSLYLVFLRLNTGSVKLSTQELRLALHPGKFMDFAMERSENSEPLKQALGLKAPDFRMRDVELFIRSFAFQYLLQKYSGNLKGFLDETCEALNGKWDTKEDEIKKQADKLDLAIQAGIDIFSKNAFRKWGGENYESRFNRAVFDVMIYYFSIETIRERALKNKRIIETAYQNLCMKNPDFIKAIESTTKSIDATQSRLTLWGKCLGKALRFEVKIPDVGSRGK